MRTVKESWESYKQLVVPHTAGPVQINETRNAFYAGAYVVFGITTMLGESFVPEEFGLAQLDALKAELEAYREKLHDAI